MDEINRLLKQTGLDEKTTLTIVSLFGSPSISPSIDGKHYSSTSIANSIVGKDVFATNEQEPKPGTLMLTDNLQFYVDSGDNVGYIYMDAVVPMATLASEFGSMNAANGDNPSKTMQKLMTGYQSATMRGFLLMLLVSHLVIPILPPSMLTYELLSTMVTLSQAKHGIHTHLAQFQTNCWKHWNISAPFSIFEKKEADSRRERERLNAQVTGWWGPAKGVPLMVFILANISVPNVENTNRSHLPVFLKKLQESLQVKMKYILRSAHLVPAQSDNNSPHSNLEFKSLFCLPNDTYPFIHLMPSIPDILQSHDEPDSGLDSDLVDIDAYLSKIDYFANLNNSLPVDKYQQYTDPSSSDTVNRQGKQHRKDTTNKRQVTTMLEDYGGKYLHQFTKHWIKAAKTRNPMHVQVITQHSNRRQETKQTNIPLPTALQFYSALVPLLSLIYGLRYGESDQDDFRKQMMADNKSTRGMVQQIEVILRKKIKNTVEIEKVFSRSHSQEIMQKCLDVYLQDSPPYYPQQYHLLKSENVLRLYKSLSRGPSAAEYAPRLQNECDNIWKQNRQSCEAISLTGKVCRLKIRHDKSESDAEQDGPTRNSKRDDRALALDTKRHNSGYSFTQACSCGRSRMSRDDPFELSVVNFAFYEKFACCLADEHKAIDLNASKFGEQQQLVYSENELPQYDASLIYLGPASTYRNTVGLERYEGFTDNTNYLLPWNLTTVSELEARAKTRSTETDAVIANRTTINNNKETPIKDTSANSEWPALGKGVEGTAVKSPTPAHVVSTEAFPSLDTTKTAPVIPTASTAVSSTPLVATSTSAATSMTPNSNITTKSNKDGRRKERRRRDGKRGGYRLEGLVRGFLGAEYECPHGHRFLSCGDGKVCKVGHKGHPKAHANHFIHQDLPLYALCPCNFADYGHTKVNPDKLAQLQRIFVVAPDAGVSITMKPHVKIKLPGTDEILDYNFGMDAPLTLPKNGVYVLRLPFIYHDPKSNQTVPLGMDLEYLLKNAIFEKDCFQVHF